MKNKVSHILGLFSIGAVMCNAQTTPTISNQVLNAGGAYRQSSVGISLTDNIGETFVMSIGDVHQLMISEGFLQPELSNGLTVMKNNETCAGRENGFISVSFTTLNKKHSEQYFWSAGACPGGNCGSNVSNLRPGVYSVTVVSTYTTNVDSTGTETVASGPIEIVPATATCPIDIFTGVTPNADGTNDIWLIKNIDLYPNNNVTLYTRWGNLVFEQKGYDNTTKFWPTQDEVSKLISTTYFYIIDLGDGSKPYKGWVELIKD